MAPGDITSESSSLTLSDPRILRGVAPSPGARHLVRADQLSALGNPFSVGKHCHRESVDCASCSSRRATAIQGHRRRLREPGVELAQLCDAPLRPLDKPCMDGAAFMAAVAVVCWRCACGEAFSFLCHCLARGKDCHTANYEAPVQAGTAFFRARIAGLSPRRLAHGPSRGDAHALWQHLTGGACEAARDLPLVPAPGIRPPSLARSSPPPSRRGSPSGASTASQQPSPRGLSPRAAGPGVGSRESTPPRSREAATTKRASWDIAVHEQSARASHGPRRPPTPGRPRLAHFYAGDERRGDVEHAARELSQPWPVDSFDKCRDAEQDVEIVSWREDTLRAARSGRWEGAIIGTPCNSWTRLIFNSRSGVSPRLRHQDYPDGVPGLDQRASFRLDTANIQLRFLCDLLRALDASGTRWIVENPYAAPDPAFEGHIFLFDHPAVATLARELGAVLIVTDQCWAFPWKDGATAGERATCDGSQKPTGFLVSRELASAASYLSRRCADLPPHTHARAIHGFDEEEGTSSNAGDAKRWPPPLCWALVWAVTGQTGPCPPCPAAMLPDGFGRSPEPRQQAGGTTA